LASFGFLLAISPSFGWNAVRVRPARSGSIRRQIMELTTLSQPSIKTQLRALYIIARKDWKVFLRYPLNAVSSIFQPLIWITPIYFMGKAFSTNGQASGFAAYSGSGDYMSYILLGTVLTNFILTVFWGMG
jgi:ABC-2 type transport system permease protein